MTEVKWYTGPVYVLVSLALVLGLSLMPATTSMVSAQGGATGTFLTGGPPTVTIDYTAASVTPATDMNVPVNVTNADRNLTELSNMTFEFWYDADGGVPTEAEFDSSPISTQEGIGIWWSSVGGFGGLVANATTFGNASWIKLTCTQPADMNTTWGIFWFNFTIGKVAKKTTGSAIWQIAARANSTDYGSGFGYDPQGVTMNFHQEVSIAANTTVDWGLVSPNLTWTDGGSQQSLGTAVTYIVNSNYTENVKSSSNWTNATASNATLDAAGTCANPQEFSLKANVSTTLPAGRLVDNVTGAVIANETITGDGTTDGGPGNVENANTLWLKLANTFETARYTGTLTYLVTEV